MPMVPLLINFPEPLLERVDRARGPATRSRFIRDATSLACSIATAGVTLAELPLRSEGDSGCEHSVGAWVVTEIGLARVCHDCQETIEVRMADDVTVLW